MARMRKVILRGDPIRNEELAAAENGIIPGHLIEMIIGTQTARRCTRAGEDVARAFALEREEMGKNMDVAYVLGDQIHEAVCKRGQRVNALIVSGVSIQSGDFVEADGGAAAGCVRLLASGVRIGRARETVAAVALTRLEIEIL
jgi:hypothetical protein